jgi:hypothetical protein
MPTVAGSGRDQRYRRALGIAGLALVVSSLAGGAVSVLAGANTWTNAWTAEATLAAPWPMLALQAAATVAAVQRRRPVSLAGAIVLGLSAAVAGISGFFDGQLGRADLGPGLVVAQVGYVLVAWATVAVAVLRLRGLRRTRRARD